MTRLLPVFCVVVTLSGYTSPPGGPPANARKWSFSIDGQLGAISAADLAAAVAAAEQSGYFSSLEVSRIAVINHNKIEVHYGAADDMADSFVNVERVHGQWSKVERWNWNA